MTVALSGTNKDDFSFTSDCTSKALAGGALCSVDVAYAPKSAPASKSTAKLTVAESGAGVTSLQADLTGSLSPSL